MTLLVIFTVCIRADPRLSDPVEQRRSPRPRKPSLSILWALMICCLVGQCGNDICCHYILHTRCGTDDSLDSIPVL